MESKWKEFFRTCSEYKNASISGGNVEELYQVFKARLVEELSVYSPELIYPASLQELTTIAQENDMGY